MIEVYQWYGSKAHKLYDPQTKRIVVIRDVVFEESEVWKWNTEFGESSEFVVDESVGLTVQLQGGGVVGGNNHYDQPQESSGGAPKGMHDVDTGEVMAQQEGGVLSDTVHSQTTNGESSINHEVDSDQVLLDDNMDVDHDDGPVRFRNLSEVYKILQRWIQPEMQR